MKKYLIVYMSTVPAEEQMKNSTPEQAKAGMDAWMAWAQRAGTAIVDLGSPLGPAVNAEDGKVMPRKSPVHPGGFSILQAESAEHLATILKGHPHYMAPGAQIACYEMMPIAGM